MIKMSRSNESSPPAKRQRTINQSSSTSQRLLPSLSQDVTDWWTEIAFGNEDYSTSAQQSRQQQESSSKTPSWYQPLVFNKQPIRYFPMLADYRSAYIRTIMDAPFAESQSNEINTPCVYGLMTEDANKALFKVLFLQQEPDWIDLEADELICVLDALRTYHTPISTREFFIYPNEYLEALWGALEKKHDYDLVYTAFDMMFVLARYHDYLFNQFVRESNVIAVKDARIYVRRIISILFSKVIDDILPSILFCLLLSVAIHGGSAKPVYQFLVEELIRFFDWNVLEAELIKSKIQDCYDTLKQLVDVSHGAVLRYACPFVRLKDERQPLVWPADTLLEDQSRNLAMQRSLKKQPELLVQSSPFSQQEQEEPTSTLNQVLSEMKPEEQSMFLDKNEVEEYQEELDKQLLSEWYQVPNRMEILDMYDACFQEMILVQNHVLNQLKTIRARFFDVFVKRVLDLYRVLRKSEPTAYIQITVTNQNNTQPPDVYVLGESIQAIRIYHETKQGRKYILFGKGITEIPISRIEKIVIKESNSRNRLIIRSLINPLEGTVRVLGDNLYKIWQRQDAEMQSNVSTLVHMKQWIQDE